MIMLWFAGSILSECFNPLNFRLTWTSTAPTCCIWYDQCQQHGHWHELHTTHRFTVYQNSLSTTKLIILLLHSTILQVLFMETCNTILLNVNNDHKLW